VTETELVVPVVTVPNTILWGFTTSAGPLAGLSDALPSAHPAEPTAMQINPAHKPIERILYTLSLTEILTSTHTQAKPAHRFQSTGEGDRKRTVPSPAQVPVPAAKVR
jgi:hypothetical protein